MHGTEPLKSVSCQKTLNEQLHPELLSTLVNQGGYPALYYRAMGMFASKNVTSSVIVMRLVNSALAVFLLGLALLTVSPRLRIGLLKSWFILLFPLASYVIASVNNSSWSVLGIGTFWVFLAEAISKGERWQRVVAVVGVALSATMALGSRPESTYFLLATAVAVIIWKKRRDELARLIGFSVIRKLVLTLLILLTALYYGRRFAASIDAYRQITPDIFSVTLLLNNLVDIPMYIAGVSGLLGRPDWPFGLGWLDILVPQVVPLTIILIAAHFFFSNSVATTRKTKVVSISLFVCLILFVLMYCQRVGFRTDRFLQPRYLLPMLFPVVGIALSVDLADFVHRYRARFMVLAMSAVGCVSLYAVMARFVWNAEISATPLSGLTATYRHWWWDISINPLTVLIIGSILMVLFVYFSMRLIIATSMTLVHEDHEKFIGGEQQSAPSLS